MPFNAAGVYTLPQPAFVTGTTISSTAVNSNFSDIASALTTSYQLSLTLSQQMQGCCQLTKSAASTLKLSPFNGNQILISGVTRALPSGGVTLTLAALTNTTLYYVYAYWSGSIVTLEASTTGYTTDTTYGNMVKTGDTTRSLVGMFYTTAVDDTVDTPARRLVASWFNPPSRTITGASMAGVTTASTSAVELGATTYRIDFVAFANRPSEVKFEGYVTNSNASVYTNTNIGVDAVTESSDLQLWNSTNPVVIGPFSVYLPLSNLSEGYHFVVPIGYVATTGTGNWTGTIRGFVV